MIDVKDWYEDAEDIIDDGYEIPEGMTRQEAIHQIAAAMAAEYAEAMNEYLATAASEALYEWKTEGQREVRADVRQTGYEAAGKLLIER